MATRRNFSTEIKANVALSAIRGDGTMAKLAGMKEGFGRNAHERDSGREGEI